MAITYKDSGVDWKLGDTFVRGIRGLVERTYNEDVRKGVGTYASLYRISEGQFLAAGADGVGTKLKLAQALNKHDTIGVDLVAMCANDVICVGARPLFFLDYIVCEKLDVEVSTAIIKGISDACVATGIALVGGETAEHPGAFPVNEYDLAGFCVGQVAEADIIDGSSVKEGDAIVCLGSSGLHSNGFSLVRKLIHSNEPEWMAEALTPTQLYVKPVLKVSEDIRIKGLAHVTGSGFNKIQRISKSVGFHFSDLRESERPKIFSEICQRSRLSDLELYSTFNMGVGMVMVVAPSDSAHTVRVLEAEGIRAWVGGIVSNNVGKIVAATPKTKFELTPSV